MTELDVIITLIEPAVVGCFIGMVALCALWALGMKG